MRKLSLTASALILIAFAAAAQVDQKKAMEAMMKAATPGDHHKALNPMVGTFDVKLKFWPAAGAPAQESTGKSVNEWVLGGRWVQQRFDGTFMSAPFNGIGYTGYDNVKQTYVGTWMDSMSTSMMTSSGGPDASGKTWMFSGTVMDPMSGEPSEVDSKLTIADNDHHTMEMTGPGPDGRMYKMMEISYSRKK